MEKNQEKKPKPSILDQWIKESVPCSFAKFTTPVPPAEKLEPLYEFNTKGTSKYSVDRMWYGQCGLIWEFKGQKNITPAVNHVTVISSDGT
jgi:hypothetical protein